MNNETFVMKDIDNYKGDFAGFSIEELKKNKNQIIIGVAARRKEGEDKNQFGLILCVYHDNPIENSPSVLYSFLSEGSRINDQIERLKSELPKYSLTPVEQINWNPLYVELNDLFK